MTHFPPIAIVGLGGVFPGADSLDRFWRNLLDRKDAVVRVTRDRWGVPPEAMVQPSPAPDMAFSDKACLVDDFRFDTDGFAIDASLIGELDPMHRMTLAAGRDAFNACRTEPVDPKRTGVILAAIALPTDGASRITREIFGGEIRNRLATATGESALGRSPFIMDRSASLAARVVAFPAALLARALGLGGATYTLDAACASSLYAVKLACDALGSGRADLLLAGGVSRPDCLYTQIGFSQLRALSPSGRCAPFDADADGLVVGEGAGVLALKRLDDAVAHGDEVLAVIRGIGLSNDMRGNLLAPDTEGQLRAMRDAYRQSGWRPRDVDLIECHGAGTPVGDAVELRSLRKLWEDENEPLGGCPIGSVKSAIGHLLTGAGAAGMIKTLLALRHKILPPSLNFRKPSPDSPLLDGPFRVQTEPAPWQRRSGAVTRRAAVSAFGFGGINAHILLESFESSRKIGVAASVAKTAAPPEPVAIVGMGAKVGDLENLRAFREAVLNGRTAFSSRPAGRWKGMDGVPGVRVDTGAFLDALSIRVGEFQIPPKEIPDILPQQLLTLQVAAAALADAHLPLRAERPRTGVTVGIGFDFETTQYHLRWHLIQAVSEWADKLGIPSDAVATWLDELQDAAGPALTAPRVLGALGSIVASRLAREFKCGGPSYVVSAEAASGIKALEIAVRSLQAGETDLFMAAAVDLAGELRHLAVQSALTPFSKTGRSVPFDGAADGAIPGEGAVALVLKRLSDAKADGDRIYAIVTGMGGATGGSITETEADTDAYLRSLNSALADARITATDIGYIETHGSGIPDQDRMEARALAEGFRDSESQPAVGALKTVTGDMGAAAGLAGVVKAGLCLYHEIIPPFPGLDRPAHAGWESGPFHVPRFPQYWFRDRADGPRRACVGVLSWDGGCGHVVLEASEVPDTGVALSAVESERRQPLGDGNWQLFTVSGDTDRELRAGVAELARHVTGERSLEFQAREWHLKQKQGGPKQRTLSLVAGSPEDLTRYLREAETAVTGGMPRRMGRDGGVAFFPEPIGTDGTGDGGLAFVYPGSGNHYLGMGRIIGARWPAILREMDAASPRLRSQMLPEQYLPRRGQWGPEWEADARAAILGDAPHLLFGQVMHGTLMTRLMKSFGIVPTAAIGYSLGESAALFANGVWPEPEEMRVRVAESDLFTTELAGEYRSVRKAWGLSGDSTVDWTVGVINRPAEAVRKALPGRPHARLLIVNTPEECVVGGLKEDVTGLIRDLKCDAVFLEGVVSVHCEAAQPVADAYRELHRFPVTPGELTLYSCGYGAPFAPDTESVANSILTQALHGFDFPALIRRAYDDGIRIFLEMGPQSSCTRMIGRILKDRCHAAVSACRKGEDDDLTVLKCLGTLMAEGVAVNLDWLHGENDSVSVAAPEKRPGTDQYIQVPVGGQPIGQVPPPPKPRTHAAASDTAHEKIPPPTMTQTPRQENKPPSPPFSKGGPGGISPNTEPGGISPLSKPAGSFLPLQDLIPGMNDTIAATAEAHGMFLDFADDLTRQYGKTFDLQTRLMTHLLPHGGEIETAPNEVIPEPDVRDIRDDAAPTPKSGGPPPTYSRDICMEFAIGSAAKVLGPEFAAVDTYPGRVRLPDEPLMLVDRILTVDGEKGSLGSGRVVTEHDVLPGAWYLDGGRAPVCISVEAGQADLFLCAYLGIDLAVKGKRTYRLLDAKATFHRGLPRPGDVIRYEIEIEKFVRQGETYMFFFHFEGYIGDEHLITMRDGCAGFFTEEEVKNSGGIILTAKDRAAEPGRNDFSPPVPVSAGSLDDAAVDALRRGDLAAAFGPDFAGVRAPESLRLPGGRMILIHRVRDFDPRGGRFGLGVIRAEADIRPDDWFLTCHFVDDMVMPGTLMFECCNHTLRVLLQRMGWVIDTPGACYEPVVGAESILKCRGPVTPETRQVLYEVEVREMGYAPEPYVLADALMYADGRRIVRFQGMSLKLTGADRQSLEAFWARRRPAEKPEPLFDRRHILEFAEGDPSKAFGAPYAVFDRERRLARLPRPPYSFLDRVVQAEPEPWKLMPGGWVETEYDVPPDEWYFRAERSPVMPFGVLLEVGLQPCGWLAAYLGSALLSDRDLKFRNLGGKATLHRNVEPDAGTLTVRTRLTQSSRAGGMIIEHFDMRVLNRGIPVYEGTTYFGFFTETALSDQKGIQDGPKRAFEPGESEVARAVRRRLPAEPPLTPDDATPPGASGAVLPSKALLMIDEIDLYIPDGGPHGLGFVRGIKAVDPEEWFFEAHFYQDPVCPGSLGLESFLQLVKFAAMERWGSAVADRRFELVPGHTHEWVYRGQSIRTNRRVEVDAVITKIEDAPDPTLYADGFLKVDGLFIYEMKGFGLRLARTGMDARS